jgi:hypothetical protein
VKIKTWSELRAWLDAEVRPKLEAEFAEARRQAIASHARTLGTDALTRLEAEFEELDAQNIADALQNLEDQVRLLHTELRAEVRAEAAAARERLVH